MTKPQKKSIIKYLSAVVNTSVLLNPDNPSGGNGIMIQLPELGSLLIEQISFQYPMERTRLLNTKQLGYRYDDKTPRMMQSIAMMVDFVARSDFEVKSLTQFDGENPSFRLNLRMALDSDIDEFARHWQKGGTIRLARWLGQVNRLPGLNTREKARLFQVLRPYLR